MAGRVDDIDLHALIADAGDLGQDGDAALALQVVGVHDALDMHFVFPEDAALVEHGVHQRGLAMVHVGDDSDVANRWDAVIHLVEGRQNGGGRNVQTQTSRFNGSVRRSERQVGRTESTFFGKSSGNREKSIYTENVLRYSEIALAKIRATKCTLPLRLH